MTPAVTDQSAARAALLRAAERVARLLRPLRPEDMAVKVPGSEWTVEQVAAHLIEVGRMYTEAATGREGSGATYLPEVGPFQRRIAALNERAIAEVLQGGTNRLGDDILADVDAYLRATEGRAGESVISTPWFGPGDVKTLEALTGVLLGELVVHGYDMAKALRLPWPIDRADARAIVARVFPAMIPLLADPEAIGRTRAAYDIWVRGGGRFVVRFENGAARTEPYSGQRVDCHIVGDPVSWLLVGYGRVSQWGPIARGKLLAWGRKPWLGTRFKSMVTNP